VISVQDTSRAGSSGSGELAGFRRAFYGCLTARADALFELTDAVLCADGPVTSLVELSLVPTHRRGHGALYDGLACGRVEIEQLRYAVTALPIPRDRQGRIVLAVDVSAWLRPDAPTSADMSYCHVSARGKGQAQMIPGWPYSFVAALEPGRTSWTALLDAQRLTPADDATAVTATQVGEVIDRLRRAGHWNEGDPPVLVVFDAGYDLPRLAYLLAELPCVVVGRLRSDRTFRFPPPPPQRRDGTPGRHAGRPRVHGPEFKLPDPATHPTPEYHTSTDTTRYGTAHAHAWTRLYPFLARRDGWRDHTGPLPIIHGSIIRLTVDRLPGTRTPKPVWLWYSRTDIDPPQIDRLWQAFLRRFDLEHTFRFLKQTLGWTRPRTRTPHQADRWTWLILTAHTQLRLARHHTHDLRRPWQKPITDPHQLTPTRVRRGFHRLHKKTTQPTHAPKPTHPGPGRPPSTPNTHKATHHPIGKS
jgi:DDE superfamily endonuclease